MGVVAYRCTASAYFSTNSGERACTVPPTGDFPFPLPSESLLAYPDAPLHQILVVEQQVLFQSGIGKPAGVGNLLHRDIRVTLQEPDGLGILFLAGAARAARQPVTDTQPIAHLLASFDYLGVVRAQLPAQVRAFQPEFTGNLRDVAPDMLHAPARLDGILVFDTGSGQLSPELSQLNLPGLFLAAQYSVTPARVHGGTWLGNTGNPILSLRRYGISHSRKAPWKRTSRSLGGISPPSPA